MSDLDGLDQPERGFDRRAALRALPGLTRVAGAPTVILCEAS